MRSRWFDMHASAARSVARVVVSRIGADDKARKSPLQNRTECQTPRRYSDSSLACRRFDGGTRMKQHLAKSLLMAGAMIASYPLLAQQSQPMQPTQPMPAAQTMQPMQSTQSSPYAQSAQSAQPTQSIQSAPSAQAMPSAQPMQGMPAATAQAPAAAPVGGDPYAQAAAPAAQTGMASTDPAIDPASMSLPPDALGARLGQRSPFLDGA
ncbi:hypothetical protein [Cupriavidus gilardii]|uniref:hypothetical protein n=1 Tax=Cupriavidus gilardii TaxID=82541 RepID=UPI001E43D1A7|nr:hypothetical protein [Cupriavidus gilardii]